MLEPDEFVELLEVEAGVLVGALVEAGAAAVAGAVTVAGALAAGVPAADAA